MLSSGRLLLREIVDSDFDAVHAYASDPKVVQYMPWGPNTETETAAFLQRAQAAAAADPRVGYELAVVKRTDSRLLGAVGLHRDTPGGAVAALGYCYDRAAWGHGYATEAARAILRFGFEELGLHRVWAGCDPDNLASARVLEKLGMTLEGRHRQNAIIQGQWRDTLISAVLSHEWTSTLSDPGAV